MIKGVKLSLSQPDRVYTRQQVSQVSLHVESRPQTIDLSCWAPISHYMYDDVII